MILRYIVTKSTRLWFIVFVCLGTVATGYELAVIGSAVGQSNFYTYFRLATSSPGYTRAARLIGALIGALIGVSSTGAIFGCLFNAGFSEQYSRKYFMLIGCMILAVGGTLSATTYDTMLLAGGFIAGWGAGLLVSSPRTKPTSPRPRREAPWCV